MTEHEIEANPGLAAIYKLFSRFGWRDPTPLGGVEFDTAGEPGPDTPEAARHRRGLDPITDDPPDGQWIRGWWDIAERSPIHEGRVGQLISFCAAVVHTTDMHPDRFDALLEAWKRSKGRGAGAHFLIGREPDEGLHQLASVQRNANHAGGMRTENGRPVPYHGWLIDNTRTAVYPTGRRFHPNMHTVGIEVHNAGLLYMLNGEWRTTQVVNGRRLPFGAPIPNAEVLPEGKKAAVPRGWHRPTPWQRDILGHLLGALADAPYRVKPPAGMSVEPNTFVPGKTWRAEVPSWAPHVEILGRVRTDLPPMPVLGHVTLDPARKGDPWPPLSAYLTSARPG
jgi:hypothetical protein